MADEDVIAIESDSNPGTFYSVNTISLICDCPYFYRKLHALSLDDPHRLCKHLVKALFIKGIPEHLSQYREDIEWFAQHKSAFIGRGHALRAKKWDKKLSLPYGSIITEKSSRKKKYYYVEGSGDEKKIVATLPLSGGSVSYKINNLNGSYDLNTQESHIPWNYRYMEQAVVNWIADEYNKTRNADTPIAAKKMVMYKLNPDPVPEGGIRTITTEKMDTSSGFTEFPDGHVEVVEDYAEYIHVVGEVNNNRIDAFVPNTGTLLYYSINGSKTYSFDISQSSSESDIDESEMGIESPLKLVITNDCSDKFPKIYQFMEKAVIKWLRNEYNRLKKNRQEKV